MPLPDFFSKDIAELIGHSRKRKLPLNDLALCCRKLAFMLEAGVPVRTALPVLAGQAMSRPLKAAISDIHVRILRGESFSGALSAAGAFPEFMCGLCAIGEKTARLPQVMAQLADYYENHARAGDELTAALTYPIAVTLMMLAVMVIAVVFVLPGYAQVFNASGVQLPVLTRWLLKSAAFLINHAYAVLFGVLLTVAGLLLFFKGRLGRECVSRIRLFVPPFKTLYRSLISMRFTQALSLMLSSGQSLSEAVPACADVTGAGDPFVRRDLRILAALLAEGRTFWESLDHVAYLDPLLKGMAQVGEETGHLPQTIAQCRDYFQHTYTQLIRRMNKLVEPVITIVLGLLLGLVMLAVILPTFALTNVF